MSLLEQQIKDFAKEQGVGLVGIAGPGRLDGPPSLDPAYVMKGARSIVSLVIPMDVDAIYEFLGKTKYQPHAMDQLCTGARLHRISSLIAGYIRSLGFRAKAVPTNVDWRRSPDFLATIPSFSHRLGAIASGIAAHGWSGNVKTEEYGSATFLGTVVTEAVLKSDKPRYTPRHFIDNHCRKCKICEKTCPAGMFDRKKESYILVNGQLHPHSYRRNYDLCKASCFGLHSLSRDKKWTHWGTRWISDWMGQGPDPDKRLRVRLALMKAAFQCGDSTPRFSMIREMTHFLQSEDMVDGFSEKYIAEKSETRRFKYLKQFVEDVKAPGRHLLKNERVDVCGHCSIVCGPTVKEVAKRYKTLCEGGFVVDGPNNEVAVVDTYEEAVKMRKKYLPKIPKVDMAKDMTLSTILYPAYFMGFDLKDTVNGFLYDRRLKRAVKNKISGHAG